MTSLAVQLAHFAVARSPLIGRARWSLPCLFLLLALAQGCVPKEVQQANQAVTSYMVGDSARARELLEPLAQKPDENYVLNNARLGSAALIDHKLAEAEGAFYRAYEVVNSTGVNDPARTAVVVLANESVRIWKGEPYERAMLNFYLGLVYYMRKDYGNARGAFENALFKLRDFADEPAGQEAEKFSTVDSNFALGYLMLAKCWQRLNRPDLARANFDRVAQLRPDLRDLCAYEWQENSNLLLVVDYGLGPQKVTSEDGTIAGFVPTPYQAGPLPELGVIVDGNPLEVEGMARGTIDLLTLAQDRKWQSLDTIRAIKSVLGTGLIVGGLGTAVYARDDETQLVGLAAAGIGLLLKGASQADVRQWEMLPRSVYLLPLRVPPGAHEVTIAAPDGLRQTWRGLTAPSQGEASYYIRLQRNRSGPYDWPPHDLPDRHLQTQQ